MNPWEWLNTTPAGQAVFSYVKVFAATILALFLADGADVFAVSADDLRLWLAAGVAAVVPVIINALNPKDRRYGVREKHNPFPPAKPPRQVKADGTDQEED